MSTDFTNSAQRPSLLYVQYARYENGTLIYDAEFNALSLPNPGAEPVCPVLLGNFVMHVTACYLSGDFSLDPAFHIDFLKSKTGAYSVIGHANQSASKFGCELWEWKERKWQLLDTNSALLWAIKKPFNVVVRHSNGVLQVWIDDVLVFEKNVVVLPPGIVGLGAGGAKVSYTNLVITKLP